MRITEFMDVYLPTSILNERFSESEWLHDIISATIQNYNFKKFNPHRFYSLILVNVLGNPKFYAVFSDVANVPIYPVVEVSVGNSIAASTNFKIVGNIIESVTIKLRVPYKLIPNLISELDSVIGHELNHIGQRIKQHKNNLLPPATKNEEEAIRYAGDNHYITYDDSFRKKINYYFLNIKEVDSHAYTYGIRLWHQFGSEAHDVLKILYTRLFDDNFNASKPLEYGSKPIDNETVLGLYNFATNFKNSEKYGKLKDDKSAIELWDKLFKEIYKYIDSRD